ncbi:hypothetical protein [Corallococcus llansteffanensis]|uniref:DUF4276 family protein n=1 Tax=Corallococcus llansteffanensis TaxID=2316731 RepID=A0A3A8PWZ7_9BACT|nr:hypothetical protein [Corallococcus llansteffanensis]RKH60966.1 hypothetical protein D7V93_12520 [Corallococcus llansteffanensis]
MTPLTYTLVADGPSDRCLEPIINWTLAQAMKPSAALIDSQFADFRDTPGAPRRLDERITRAVEQFPCDLLFVHRDAERDSPERRRDEIAEAIRDVGLAHVVCIVPVRMTEAWLLFDEPAIRRAAGNPHGTVSLNLPAASRFEVLPDPKQVLGDALLMASEAKGRKLRQFQRDISMLKHRVAELIEDFTPLRRLSAFQAFEHEVRAIVEAFR